MEEKPLISVIIPTYNRANMLKRAVKSVLNQTFTNFELIIIDDCSNDNTEKNINNFLKIDKRIKLIKNTKNLGPSISRNIGILKSKGKFIAFLDSDDEWMPKKIQMQIERFKNNNKKNIGFVCCRSLKIDHNGTIVDFDKFFYKKINDPIKYQLLKGNICTTTSLLVKREILNKVGMFKKLAHGEEYVLVLEMLARGYKVDFVDEFLCNMYLHKKGRLSDNIGKDELAINNIFKIKQKYFKYLSKKEIIQANQDYFFRIFRLYLDKKKIKAFFIFLRIIGNNPYNLKNYIKGIVGLFFGLKYLLWVEKKGEKFKKYIFKIFLSKKP